MQAKYPYRQKTQNGCDVTARVGRDGPLRARLRPSKDRYAPRSAALAFDSPAVPCRPPGSQPTMESNCAIPITVPAPSIRASPAVPGGGPVPPRDSLRADRSDVSRPSLRHLKGRQFVVVRPRGATAVPVSLHPVPLTPSGARAALDHHSWPRSPSGRRRLTRSTGRRSFADEPQDHPAVPPRRPPRRAASGGRIHVQF